MRSLWSILQDCASVQQLDIRIRRRREKERRMYIYIYINLFINKTKKSNRTALIVAEITGDLSSWLINPNQPGADSEPTRSQSGANPATYWKNAAETRRQSLNRKIHFQDVSAVFQRSDDIEKEEEEEGGGGGRGREGKSNIRKREKNIYIFIDAGGVDSTEFSRCAN